MEMLQLRYFYESAKTESITQTAKKYMVPTSSVSSSISRLEEELGVKLFNRTSNRITLNDKGRQFFKSISHIFSELDNAVGNLTVEEEDNRKIHILVRANRDTLVRRIVDYNARHPKSAFKLNFDFAETDYDKYEIIIEEKNDKHPDYEGFELFQYQYRIRINASTDNPLCQRKLNLKQLYNQPFISTGEQNDIYKIVVRACNRVGFTPELIMECNDYQCYDRCVRGGMGLGITLEGQSGNPPAGTEFLDISDFDERYIVYVYYKKQEYYGNIKEFIDYLKTRTE